MGVTGALTPGLLDQGAHMLYVLIHGQFLAHREGLLQQRHGLLPVARPLTGQQHGGIMALRLRQHWTRLQKRIALHGGGEVRLRRVPLRQGRGQLPQKPGDCSQAQSPGSATTHCSANGSKSWYNCAALGTSCNRTQTCARLVSVIIQYACCGRAAKSLAAKYSNSRRASASRPVDAYNNASAERHPGIDAYCVAKSLVGSSTSCRLFLPPRITKSCTMKHCTASVSCARCPIASACRASCSAPQSRRTILPAWPAIWSGPTGTTAGGAFPPAARRPLCPDPPPGCRPVPAGPQHAR